MFSTRARYALHGVGFLAYHYSEVPVAFAQILDYLKGFSGNLSLSPGYIKKVFQDLSRAGVLRAMVGRKGGYALAHPPKKTRVVDVVGAIDGYPREECCLLAVGGCDEEDKCGVRALIERAHKQFYDFLASQTADSLAKKMFARRGPVSASQKSAKARRAKGRAGKMPRRRPARRRR